MKKISCIALVTALIAFTGPKLMAQDGNWFFSVNLYGGPYNLAYNPCFDQKYSGWDYTAAFTDRPPEIIASGWDPHLAKLNPGNRVFQELAYPVMPGDTIQFAIRGGVINGGTGKFLRMFVRGFNYGGSDYTTMRHEETLNYPANGGHREFQYDYIVPADVYRLVFGVAFDDVNNSPNAYAEVRKVYIGIRKGGQASGSGNNGGGTPSQWADNSATRISYANQVAIGGDQFYNDNEYKLSVNGKMVAEELLIELRSTWPDYVFDPAYKKPTLREMEAFIQQHRHLPGIPSEKQVKEKGGVELGELNRKMLEKMEEMMLYLIDMDKKYRELEQRFKALKGKEKVR